MNWGKALLAGVLGGLLMWVLAFVLHGLVLGATYTKYPEVFSQEASNPAWFLLIEILIAIPAAVIFAKTRASWSDGIAGGVTFGFWIGLFGFFAQFFNSLVIEGFPYFLSWCWGGVNMILSLALGALFGLMIKRT